MFLSSSFFFVLQMLTLLFLVFVLFAAPLWETAGLFFILFQRESHRVRKRRKKDQYWVGA